MVVCTLLSAPMMFVSAQLLTITYISPKDYIIYLDNFLLDISVLALLASIFTGFIFLISKNWRNTPHCHTLALISAQGLVEIKNDNASDTYQMTKQKYSSNDPEFHFQNCLCRCHSLVSFELYSWMEAVSSILHLHVWCVFIQSLCSNASIELGMCCNIFKGLRRKVETIFPSQWNHNSIISRWSSTIDCPGMASITIKLEERD